MKYQNSAIEIDGFGIVPDKPYEIIKRFTLTNKNGGIVKLISLGAGIQSILIPDKDYSNGDVIVGFDDVLHYIQNRYIGRITNRVGPIENPRCQRNCIPFYTKQYENNFIDSNSLDLANWESYKSNDQVIMSKVSHCKIDEYSANLSTTVKYTWTDSNELNINMRSVSTHEIPVNLVSHCLFNLAGHNAGSREIKNHIVTINAEKWIHTDAKNYFPTGVIQKVSNTVFDLRHPTKLSKKYLYKIPGGGFNQHFCVNSPDRGWCNRFHSSLFHPKSKKVLEMYSNHPTVYINTDNMIEQNNNIVQNSIKHSTLFKINQNNYRRMIGKGGILYERHGSIALISEGFPQSLKYNHFPKNVLKPGKIYTHDITYRFGTSD